MGSRLVRAGTYATIAVSMAAVVGVAGFAAGRGTADVDGAFDQGWTAGEASAREAANARYGEGGAGREAIKAQAFARGREAGLKAGRRRGFAVGQARGHPDRRAGDLRGLRRRLAGRRVVRRAHRPGRGRARVLDPEPRGARGPARPTGCAAAGSAPSRRAHSAASSRSRSLSSFQAPTEARRYRVPGQEADRDARRAEALGGRLRVLVLPGDERRVAARADDAARLLQPRRQLARERAGALVDAVPPEAAEDVERGERAGDRLGRQRGGVEALRGRVEGVGVERAARVGVVHVGERRRARRRSRHCGAA